jgi:LCP family protein required for cell wall assembly
MSRIPPGHRRLVAVAAVVATGTLAVTAVEVFGPSLRFTAGTVALARTLARNDASADVLARPAAGAPVTYLVVGSDSRERLPRGTRFVGRLRGQRADSITMWWVAPGEPPRVLSIPRDLRVTVAGHTEQKLGGAYEYGAAALAKAVKTATGLPAHHVIEVDFAGFVRAVDLVGGVTVTFRHAARDTLTGFAVAAGRRHLDGQAALALARSRRYQELRNGRWTAVANSDLGRISRQQLLLRALASRLRGVDDPWTLRRALAGLRQHIAVDESFGHRDVARLFAVVAEHAGAIAVTTLPTRPRIPAHEAMSPFPPAHLGSVGYLVRDEPAASAVIRAFMRGGR